MTDKPFAEALEELLREREWSGRELARRTQKEHRWGSNVHLNELRQGKRVPSPEAMEIIAKTLRLPSGPEHFAEYRIEQARHALNYRKTLIMEGGTQEVPDNKALNRALRILQILEEAGFGEPGFPH